MKKISLSILICFITHFAFAQDYLITFSGTGESNTVASVKVENLTQNKSLTLNGSDVLHLKKVVTGISDLTSPDHENIRFYPNPALDYSLLEFNLIEEGTVRTDLFDISGRVILQKSEYLTQGLHSYRFSGLSQGIYVVRITSGAQFLSGILVCEKPLNGNLGIELNESLTLQRSENVLKSANGEISMQYNAGDLLKYTGISGKYKTVVTDIPTGNKTIGFSFYSCSDNDGKDYSIVKIGTQWWMAENLQTTKYNDGTTIPNGTDATTWSSTIGAYCWYNNNATNYQNLYGALYNWFAVNTDKLAPKGWHVPSDTEWTTLENFIISNGYNFDGTTTGNKIAKSLAASTNWATSSYAGAIGNNLSTNNRTGFSALPGGHRNLDGSFSNVGYGGNWWSSTLYSGVYVWNRTLENGVVGLNHNYPYKPYGFSVRCVMDEQKAFCGSPLIINHVAGVVAPVTKTVTYGTVTNIPGEPTKCWITSNLGSDRQATAVNDATEASAGWYWQFNRKQGYKHDGTTRTPNSAWTNSISESSDWISTNDPCSIELGIGWRIPTSTEWNNVITSGSWTNWNGPWNSGLKLHAAGYLLNDSFGSLSDRGSQARNASSTQNNTTFSFNLLFSSLGIEVFSINKSSPISVRCLRDAGSSSITPTVTTTAVSNITQTSATSGGIVTSDGGATVTARGVCWGTSPNPTTSNSKTTDGIGTGTFVSNLTGLTPNTPFYARAYATNSIGTAYGNELSFTTLGGSSACGSAITINHVAGAVAPVTKTVTYGTVTNIPGEPTKCWITRNLGASQQATTVTDDTEASAGWYWQFNRKQGYKYDGSTRTPNSTWISSISENSDWSPTNDPCTLELGSGWHIPTYTEWFNVDASGNWTTRNDTWNSGLKLHAAGYQADSNGTLNYKGTNGVYWSSTQNGLYGWNLLFHSSISNMGYSNKAGGFSVRCIK